MTNSKWQIHRIGLINFWYYDEEEFYFLDGRMLLRGANGSGKSVTMQSFIPLLLDGNMRPERLDPFGSKARKMENYLLEEDDDREERTGYLYMELKRLEADEYVTIGIGLRGRKNKKLESWYFCITDGRRIGKDIFLYKDVQSKIPYSKIELRNRIEDGGRVMETQGEYAECVNRLLFGFETIEEYKEMIELLIQLRTPKLSKEFKPSVINDILSSSLQTLSEDDLRPLSEAIENMDSVKTNLDVLRGSVKAAGAIKRVYDQYNKRMLFDKARGLLDARKEYSDNQKKEKQLNEKYAEGKQELQRQEELYRKLCTEQDTLTKEKESLNQNDAIRLKDEEQRLLREEDELKADILKKEKQEEAKKSSELAKQNEIKALQQRKEKIWENIGNSLEEMEAEMTDVPFDSCDFLIKEVKENAEKTVSFDIYEKELKEYQEKVHAGVKILEDEQRERIKYDEILEKLDRKKAEREQSERQLKQYDNQLHETREELIEQLYKWEKSNNVLKLENTVMQQLIKELEQYHYGQDYSDIKEIVRKAKHLSEEKILEEKRVLDNLSEPKIQKKNELVEIYESRKNQKEPEPERTEAVTANRKVLREKGIPFHEFYKAVEFSAAVSENEMLAGHIEEALLHMGILDAVIIAEEYRDVVMSLDEGLCDKYIFSDAEYVKHNLSEFLDVDNRENDIIFYQQISRALSGIGIYDSEEIKQTVWLDANGNYKLGMLEGTVTGQYKPRFIGTAARERYRQDMLKTLEEQISVLEEEIDSLNRQKEDLQSRLTVLEDEWNSIPKETDLKVAVKDYFQAELQMNISQNAVKEEEEHLAEQRKVLEKVRLQVSEICKRTYLAIGLDVFRAAEKALGSYQKLLGEVKINYASYQNHEIMIRNNEETLEQIIQDLDDIRYDLGQRKQKLIQIQAKIVSVNEQLALTDYHQVKERIDYCIERLGKIPVERERVVERRTELENSEKNILSEIQKNQGILQQLATALERIKSIFAKEYMLGYVPEVPENECEPEEMAEKVCLILESQITTESLMGINEKLQAVFHENKGELAEFNLSQGKIFDEPETENMTLKIQVSRVDINAKYHGTTVNFNTLVQKLKEDVEVLEKILSDKDKELFEDILTNTVSKKIRARIHNSKRWVEAMNELMESMQTSSGLRLSLRWKSKKAEKEEQMDTKVLVELLQKDSEIMREDEVEKMSMHFRSKIAEARKRMEDISNLQSFHAIVRDILDYRKWFEFQLECQKTGEKKKELTDRVFFTFSGGEKAMAMYVPLFSAVVAKYGGARKDAPRLISLDEAFAGVDEMNIKDMFRLMVQFEFDFMINSQILWGDYETVPSLAIYQLIRPENAKYVSVISYTWNGKVREMTGKTGD